MKKCLLLMPFALFLLMPLALAFADTSTIHIDERTVCASWTGSSSYVMVTVCEMTKPQRIVELAFEFQDTSNGVSIFKQRELDDNEFGWNSAGCTLNTEIAGSSLTVTWTTIDQRRFEHTSEKIEVEQPVEASLHLTSTITTRKAEATLNWNGRIMQGNGQIVFSHSVCTTHCSEDPEPPSPP